MSANERDNKALAAAVTAAGQERLGAELAALYQRLEVELSPLDARCQGCGKCCDFAAFGHRLYVTPIELAELVRQPPASRQGAAVLRCPYQVNSHCTAHDRRTLGCRVFFCRLGDEQAHRLYERHHAELRALHERAGVPYLYVELTAALGRIP